MSAEIETLHRPFAAFLRRAGIPFLTPRSDRESTIAEGHPDFTLLLAGRCLMVEFKTKDGKTSKVQRDRIAELEAAGCRVLVVRELSAAIEIVEAWRASLGELPAPLVQSPASPEPELVRVGNGVFRRDTTTGRLDHLRVATAGDEAIPRLHVR